MSKQIVSQKTEYLSKIREELMKIVQESGKKQNNERLCVLGRSFAKIAKGLQKAEYVKHAQNIADALIMTFESNLENKTLDEADQVQ